MACRTVGDPRVGSWASTRACTDAQPRTGVDAELVRQHGPGAVVGAEGVALAPGTVERGDEDLPEPLAHRVLADEPLELGHRRRRAPQGELRGETVLRGSDPQLLEPASLGGGEGGAVEAGIRRSAPQGQRLGERRRGILRASVGQAALTDAGEPGEPLGVDLRRLEGEAVAGALGEQDRRAAPAVRLERVPQPQHEGLQGLGRAGGRLLAPQGVHEVARGHEATACGDEPGKQQPLLRPPDLDGAPGALHAKRSEDRVVHVVTVGTRVHGGRAFHEMPGTAAAPPAAAVPSVAVRR